MSRPPPRSTRLYTRFPDRTRFRSCGAGPCYLYPGVAERRPFLEGAGGLAVDTEMALLGDARDRLADQRPARRVADPDDHAIGARLPAKRLDRVDRKSTRLNSSH